MILRGCTVHLKEGGGPYDRYANHCIEDEDGDSEACYCNLGSFCNLGSTPTGSKTILLTGLLSLTKKFE